MVCLWWKRKSNPYWRFYVKTRAARMGRDTYGPSFMLRWIRSTLAGREKWSTF
jgi:hypothetical protein